MSKKLEPVVLSKDFLNAVNHVNGDVVYDLPRNASYEMIAETCLDANRLETWGHPEAEKELKELIARHGYPRVLRAVAKTVSKA